MALLTADQKQKLQPLINGFWTLVLIAVFVSLACRYILDGYPSYIAWLAPFFGLVVVIAAVLTGILVADRNKLVK